MGPHPAGLSSIVLCRRRIVKGREGQELLYKNSSDYSLEQKVGLDKSKEFPHCMITRRVLLACISIDDIIEDEIALIQHTLYHGLFQITI